MANYQKPKGELGRARFFQIFGSLDKESKLKLAYTLGKITEVIKL